MVKERLLLKWRTIPVCVLTEMIEQSEKLMRLQRGEIAAVMSMGRQEDTGSSAHTWNVWLSAGAWRCFL